MSLIAVLENDTTKSLGENHPPFVNVNTLGNRITAAAELNAIVRTNLNAIFQFRRSSISLQLLQEITEDCRQIISDSHNPFTSWNGVGGDVAFNAAPHRHYYFNFHAVPVASLCGTGFFNNNAYIEAIQTEMRVTQQKGLRQRLESTLNDYAEDNSFNTLVDRVQDICDNQQIGGNGLVDRIQRHLRKSGGQVDVEYGKNQNAIVGIPSNCLHGRSMSRYTTRNCRTAFRYLSES